MASTDRRRQLFGMFIPNATHTSAYTAAKTTCSAVKVAYEEECCDGDATFDQTKVQTANCFVEAGAHVAHAEGFNGEPLRRAPSCACVIDGHAWLQCAPSVPVSLS